MSFIPLRNHSHYSLLKALPKIDELVLAAIDRGYTSLSLTDYGNMYGTLEFYQACIKHKIKPIIGVEFTLQNDGQEKTSLVAIAHSLEGYKNLMKIISIISVDNPEEPKLTDNVLCENADGLILLSGGPLGDVSLLLLRDEQQALARINWYQSVVGVDNFYLEVTPHTFMDHGAELRSGTISCAKKYKVPLVATTNSHYLSINDKSAHKTLMLISGGETSLDYYNHYFQKGDFHFPDLSEVESMFADVPEAIEETSKIAEKCNLEIKLGSWVFPNIEYKKSYNEDLRDLAYAGIPIRGLEETEEVVNRLEYELKVIADKGYSPYFLVVYDLLRFARENNILTNIRGSVAGSITTYLLQVTKCNPLEYKLPFERFLNPERPSAPDIDMDFADTRRDDVLDYARKKYGIDNVAQIGTFGTMLAKGAVRDVARAMKFPYMVGDRISKLVPLAKQGFPVTIDTAIAEVPELKELYDTDREVQIILDMAKKIEGCARHISVHAAGTVISPLPLWEFTPIQKDPKGGKIITQYDMYTIEDAGLLKFDFLGIRNLTILSDAIEIAKERYGKIIDIEAIPLDDKKTFAMLTRGETMGLFQLNGSGMTHFLKELAPTTIFDINAMVALYRPGPLEMIPEYIKRKHNPALIQYLDPRLETILDQSFGVITYQDDVMLIAIHLAGYSWLEADKLRKAMGKKIPKEMQAQKEKLLEGFVAHGLSKKLGAELWRLIEPFAAYGFNKAHAASYGRVAYQTSYMKANFPVAYMTAVLTNESGDIDKVSEIVLECKRMGIEVQPPNVNSSMGGFSIVGEKISTNNDNLWSNANAEKILFGLYTIKGLGTDISDAIIKERSDNGPYTSFENFIARVNHKNLNKRSLEALAMCGALDTLASRGDILHNMESILKYHKDVIKDNSNQGSLFGEHHDTSFTLKKGEDIAPMQKLIWEKELLGLYVSGFPLDPWKDKIKARGMDIDYILHRAGEGESVSFACLIDNIRVTKTKKGDPMAILRVRDYLGTLEVAVFPETYKKVKSLCIQDATIVIKGKVGERNNEKTLVVDEITKLEIAEKEGK